MNLYGHVLLARPHVDLFDIESVNMSENLPSFLYAYHIQCGKKNEITSTLGNIHLSGFYAWETKLMVLQSPAHPSSKDVHPPADVEDKVTEMGTAFNDGISEATGMAVRCDKS